MKLTAWRAALRIARRDALRAKGRSALVLAMIALPVLGVAGTDVVYRSSELGPQTKATRLLGGADALLSSFGRGLTVQQAPNAEDGATTEGPANGGQPTAEQRRSQTEDPGVLAKELLPAGSRLTPAVDGPHVGASTRDGQLGADTTEADLADPIWHGRLNLVAGRAPGTAQELAVTQAFLDQAHLKLGDTTALRGLADRPFTITAVVEYPDALGRVELVGRPGALIEPLRTATGQPAPGADVNFPSGGTRWLVKLPAGAVLDWAKVMELDKYGFTATSRTVMLDPPRRSEVPYFVRQDRYNPGSTQYLDRTGTVILATVAGMAFLEIVLLAGPAFAVGARRSRRQLGLIAAGGGDRSHVRAVVLGGGVVLGVAGAVVGVVLAVVTVAVGRPWLEELAGSRFGQLGLQPLDLIGVAAIGLVTGLLAAVVPAVQASRQDVVEALTGRGSIRPANRKLALLGLLMVGGGAALALLGTAGAAHETAAVLGGSVIAELGMVACTPMLVSLFGRLGRWLPLSPRLALRDSVRHRGRTAPAVAAVMAAVAGAVAVGVYTTSSDQEMREAYVANLPSGAVVVSQYAGPGADLSQLSLLRTAVEQSMPALGTRADVYTTEVGDCSAGGCGFAQVEIPKERRCPLTDEDRTPDQKFDQAESARLMHEDPRCANITRSGGYGPFGNVPAGDADLLRNLVGVKDPAAEQALAQGKAVVFDGTYLKDGKITLKLTDPPTTAKGSGSAPSQQPVVHEVSVEAVLTSTRTPNASAVVSPETARALGLTTREFGSAWLPDTVPGSTAEQKADAAIARITDSAHLDVERGFRSQRTLVNLGLTGFSALVALGAAGIATGLAAADSQRDLATLAAVGAAGGIRRRLSGFQCGVIAAMGTVLGTVCGIVPAVALRKVQALMLPPDPYGMARSAHHAVIAFPWLNIGITLIGLPLVALLLAMLLTRSRIALTRRA